MHTHLIVFLAQEKNMIAKHEGYHLVELKHGIKASYQEASEGIEFLKVFEDYFIAV